MSNAYQNASLIVTPNAYKASKIYALKPTDGSGDLSFSRAGSKMVRNSSGLWETIGTNIPPLHYPVGGGCPSWLFEAEATCLIPASNLFIGDCTKTTGITDSPISGLTSVRITKTSASAEYVVSSYSAAIASATPYAISLYFKYDGHDIDSSLEFNNSGDFGVLWRCDIAIRSTGITISSTTSCTAELIEEANGWYRLEVSLTTATVINNSGSILILASGDNGATFLITTSNITQEANPSSPILTSVGNVTRFADVPTTKNISLGVDEGSFYFQLKERPSAQPDYNGISENSAINGSGKNILCYDGGIYHNLGGGFNALTAIANNDKVCIFWNSTTLWVSKNGATAATFNKTGITFNPLFWNQCRVGANIVGTILYDDSIFYTACLSITEANNLTA
ncbi:MAG: hypothetical protein KBE91_11880 [Bacteroidia bacterium]|nr:hypothetical protein [Bacteroidia bacterium]